MNILFFLTPKNEVAYIYEDDTLRQSLEKMERSHYSCIPVLNKDGKYTGSISEGDFLWGMKLRNLLDIKDTEKIPVSSIPRRSNYQPVKVHSKMEDLFDRAINQNYVPVVDDEENFIGIITRKAILKYCYKQLAYLEHHSELKGIQRPEIRDK